MRWWWPWRTRADKAAAVLTYLARHGETLGRDLGEACGLGKYTCYILFADLEEQGLISGRKDPNDYPFHRRLYTITRSGRGKLVEQEHVSAAALAWGI